MPSEWGVIWNVHERFITCGPCEWQIEPEKPNYVTHRRIFPTKSERDWFFSTLIPNSIVVDARCFDPDLPTVYDRLLDEDP